MLLIEYFKDGQKDVLVNILNELKSSKLGYQKINNGTNKKLYQNK